MVHLALKADTSGDEKLCRQQETHELLLEARHASAVVPEAILRRPTLRGPREATKHLVGTPQERVLRTTTE